MPILCATLLGFSGYILLYNKTTDASVYMPADLMQVLYQSGLLLSIFSETSVSLDPNITTVGRRTSGKNERKTTSPSGSRKRKDSAAAPSVLRLAAKEGQSLTLPTINVCIRLLAK